MHGLRRGRFFSCWSTVDDNDPTTKQPWLDVWLINREGDFWGLCEDCCIHVGPPSTMLAHHENNVFQCQVWLGSAAKTVVSCWAAVYDAGPTWIQVWLSPGMFGVCGEDCAANTRRSAKVVSMLGHRLRRCPNIETTLAERLLFILGGAYGGVSILTDPSRLSVHINQIWHTARECQEISGRAEAGAIIQGSADSVQCVLGAYCSHWLPTDGR